MSGVRSLHRGPLQKGVPTAASAPIRVDDSTSQVKVAPYGSNSVENIVQTAADAPVLLTGNTSLTQALHAGVPLVFNNAAGGTITLPAATGSGAKYQIFIGTTVTSNSFVVQVANNADYFRGQASTVGSSGITVAVTANTGTVSTESDTITWNRTTTGLATQGDYIDLLDIAPHVWSIDAIYSTAGQAAATPFSAAV